MTYHAWQIYFIAYSTDLRASGISTFLSLRFITNLRIRVISDISTNGTAKAYNDERFLQLELTGWGLRTCSHR